MLVNAEEQKRGDSTLLTLTNDNSNSKQNKRDAQIIGKNNNLGRDSSGCGRIINGILHHFHFAGSQNHHLGGYSPLSISSAYPLSYVQPVSHVSQQTLRI